MVDYTLQNFFESALIKNKIPADLFIPKNKQYTLAHSVTLSRMDCYFIESFMQKDLIKALGKENISYLKRKSNLRIIRTLENIRFANLLARKLNNNGIDYVYLKGIPMIDYFYKKAVFRSLSDIDILVKNSDLNIVIKFCKELGFITNKWDDLDTGKLKIYKNPNPPHHTMNSRIDIHVFGNSETSRFEEISQSFFEESRICSKKQMYINSPENTFIHCLYHGTEQSNLSTGPIFINDIKKMIDSNKIDFKLVNKKIKKYDLGKYSDLMQDFFTSMKLTYPLPRYKNLTRLGSEKLKLVFLSPPLNSSFYILKKKNNLWESSKIIFNRLFSRENILHHSQEEISANSFLKNLFYVIQNNFIKITQYKDSQNISNAKYEIIKILNK